MPNSCFNKGKFVKIYYINFYRLLKNANYLISCQKFRSQPIEKKGYICFLGLEKAKPGNPGLPTLHKHHDPPSVCLSVSPLSRAGVVSVSCLSCQRTLKPSLRYLSAQRMAGNAATYGTEGSCRNHYGMVQFSRTLIHLTFKLYASNKTFHSRWFHCRYVVCFFVGTFEKQPRPEVLEA